MNYKKIYDDLVNKCKHREIKRGQIGYEVHHILPRSMGGNNREENLVKFSLRQHFVAHRLLAKFTTGRDKMNMRQAVVLMCGSGNYRVTSRTFEKVKLQRQLSLRSIKVEAFGTPSTHFPMGHFSKSFGTKYGRPKEIEYRDWRYKLTGFYYYAVSANKLGYNGLSMGGGYGAKGLYSTVKKFIKYGLISESYKGEKGDVKLYDFTEKFNEMSVNAKCSILLKKIATDLATAPRNKRGVGIAKEATIEYNKKNPRKLVKLVWSKDDPYVKKINAWEGDLPDLVLKYKISQQLR